MASAWFGVAPSPLESAVAEASAARDQRLSREARRVHGVVHTPHEIVRAVLHGLDARLRQAGWLHGLFDPAVTVVDPACGPGAFVATLLTLAAAEGRAPGRCFALDADRQSVESLAGLCLEPAQALGCELRALHVDSLDFELPSDSGPVLVVGNPPWAVAAAQTKPTAALAELLDDFRRDEHGERLKERKLGVLSDAYVRFFRQAAAWVESASAGGGLSLVTNGSFLDGPVHRGMRHALLARFDVVETVDLGGNALLSRSVEERAKGRDENVFGVRPAVAVTWALRLPPTEGKRRLGRLYSTQVRGLRPDKLKVLSRLAQAGVTKSQRLPAAPPLFLFVPRASIGSAAYRQAVSLAEAMPFHREGVQTNRDAALVADNPGALVARLRQFAEGDVHDPALASLVRPLRHYDPVRARKAVSDALSAGAGTEAALCLRRIAYRPFMLGYLAALPGLCHRPRPDLQAAIDVSPYALLSVRKDRGTAPYHHAALVTAIADSSYLSARSSCRTRVFPLRTPKGALNVDGGVLAAWSASLGVSVGAEDFVDYALSLLHSLRFCRAFGVALREDYARIITPPTPAFFATVCALGAGLRAAYLHTADVRAAQLAGSQPLAPADSAPAVQVGHRRYAAGAQLQPLSTALSAVHAMDAQLPEIWFR